MEKIEEIMLSVAWDRKIVVCNRDVRRMDQIL